MYLEPLWKPTPLRMSGVLPSTGADVGSIEETARKSTPLAACGLGRKVAESAMLLAKDSSSVE